MVIAASAAKAIVADLVSSPFCQPELEPWYRKKSFTLCHEAKLEEALFSRDLVDRLKKGYDFLLPYYDYFITLDSDPDPREV